MSNETTKVRVRGTVSYERADGARVAAPLGEYTMTEIQPDPPAVAPEVGGGRPTPMLNTDSLPRYRLSQPGGPEFELTAEELAHYQAGGELK